MIIPNPLSSFKNWCIFLLLIGVLVLWFTRGCGSQPPAVIVHNNEVNDSVAKLVQQAQANEMQVGLLMEDTIRLHSDLKHARDSLKRSTIAIHAANSQVTALANEVADAQIRKDTSSFFSACDSLQRAALIQKGTFVMYERDSKNALDNCDALSLKKSHIIAALTSEKNGYKSAGEMLLKQNGVLAKALTPKAKLFIGGEVFTSVSIAGVGPGIMYETKSEKLFGISGGIATTGGWWIGGKMYIKIQLHK